MLFFSQTNQSFAQLTDHRLTNPWAEPRLAIPGKTYLNSHLFLAGKPSLAELGATPVQGSVRKGDDVLALARHHCKSNMGFKTNEPIKKKEGNALGKGHDVRATSPLQGAHGRTTALAGGK